MNSSRLYIMQDFTYAIEHKNKQIKDLKQRQEELIAEKDSLQQKQKNIIEQEEEIKNQVSSIEESNDFSEEEKQIIEKEIKAQQEELLLKKEEIGININHIELESTSISSEIESKKEEIISIENSSSIKTEGGRGSLKINLKWNTQDDLDLHVIDPDKQEIFYGQKEKICQGIKGMLDIDANASDIVENPQENIFWEEGKEAPKGIYEVKVVLYKKRSSTARTRFTVTIYPGKGEPKTITGYLSHEKDEKMISSFEYDENGIMYLN